MDIIVWVLMGAAVAWVAFSFLNWNPGRGLVISAIIGVGATFFGGNVLAPMFGSGTTDGTGFSPFALIVAAVTAVAFLKIADIVHERFQF